MVYAVQKTRLRGVASKTAAREILRYTEKFDCFVEGTTIMLPRSSVWDERPFSSERA